MSDHPNLVRRPLIVYHANCADGFTAAWAARRKFGDGADYVPATHQDPPPNVAGRDPVLVDFSYKREVLRRLAREARSILILDHHKSAAEDLYADADIDNRTPNTAKFLAEKFGVAPHTIREIWRGDSWARGKKHHGPKTIRNQHGVQRRSAASSRANHPEDIAA